MHRISVTEVSNAGEYVISKLPEYWQRFYLPILPRISEEISWIYLKGGTVVDIGGGSGFHSAVCAKLGMKAINVDNFKIEGINII